MDRLPVLLMVPPAWLKLLVIDTLPPPVSVPPPMLKEFKLVVPLAANEPPLLIVRLPANVDAVVAPVKVNAPPLLMERLLLEVEVNASTVRALLRVAVTPATRLSCANAVVPGSWSPVQLRGFSQVTSTPPPPSQHTPVQATPECVSR